MVKGGHPTKVFEKKQLGNKFLRAYHPKREDEESLFFVPKNVWGELSEWYHNNLKHPGTDRLLETIQLHFSFPGMSKALEEYSRTCDIYQ